MSESHTLANEWHERAPKVELHVHLEGAIPHPTLWSLVQKYGGAPDLETPEDLERRFRYCDFPHFIDTWVWKNGFLRSYEDFEYVAGAVASWWRAQNVVYVEAFYSPGDFARHGLRTQELTCAIRRGLDRVPGIRVNLVADLIRDFGPERALVTLSEVAEVRNQGVIGVGIGGSEQEFPPEPFAAVFEHARKLGFRTSAHAGEAAGPGSVWGAIRSLGVDRIGHGTRCVEDPELVDWLAREGLPLELCPLSNVRTGVIRRLEEHPLRTYLDAGLRISVNTDDPAMFGQTLAEELRQAEYAFGLSRARIRELILDSADQAWLSPPERTALQERLRTDPAW